MTRPRLRLTLLLAVVAAAAVGGHYWYHHGSSSAPPPVALVTLDARAGFSLSGGVTESPEEFEEFRNTQLVLVKSRDVATTALRQGEAAALEIVKQQADPPAWLAARVTAEYASRTVLRIGVSGVPPKDAAVLANAVTKAYLDAATNFDFRKRDTHLHKLTKLLNNLQARRNDERRAIRLAEEATGVVMQPADRPALVAALYQERAALRVELARARVWKDGKPADPSDRERGLIAEIAGVEDQLKALNKVSQHDLESVREGVRQLDDAIAVVGRELIRWELERHSPLRVSIRELAHAPDGRESAAAPSR